MDILPLPGVDVVRDVRRGLPFGDKHFETIQAMCIFEHLLPPDWVFLLNEMYRVLVVNGIATITVPTFDSEGAYRDPTHLSFFSPRSCEYWGASTRFDGRSRGITAEFELVDFAPLLSESDRVKYVTWNVRAIPQPDALYTADLYPEKYTMPEGA